LKTPPLGEGIIHPVPEAIEVVIVQNAADSEAEADSIVGAAVMLTMTPT
jgi:hypothetical protein